MSHLGSIGGHAPYIIYMNLEQIRFLDHRKMFDHHVAKTNHLQEVMDIAFTIDEEFGRLLFDKIIEHFDRL